MKQTLWEGLKGFLPWTKKDVKSGEELTQQPAHRSSLMKSRPIEWDEKYNPSNDATAVDGLFLRLRRYMYRETDRMAKQGVTATILREAGRLGADRPYFFLQPLNEKGWLFERSGAGWVVSLAQKIATEDTFIRDYEAWDQVTVFQPPQAQVGSFRVSSKRLALEYVSFAVYEQLLLERFGSSVTKNS